MSDSGENEPLVLGAQLAAAQAAEERHRARVSTPSPLAGVGYERAEAIMWRWSDAPADSVITSFLDGYRVLDPPSATATRAALTIDDFYTLLLYVRRRVLAAIRADDAGMVPAAYDALSAIDIERVDWRDVYVGISLAGYGAHRLDVDAAAETARVVVRADPPVAGVLTDSAASDVTNANAAGVREVMGADGPIFLTDFGDRFKPVEDLVGLAFGLTERLEADTYEVTDITVGSDLPAVWLGEIDEETEAAHRRLKSCLNVDAVPRVDPGQKFLLIFIAEAARDGDAALVAAAANAHALPDSAQLAVAGGRVCVVLISRSVKYGEQGPESAETLERFRPILTELLG